MELLVASTYLEDFGDRCNLLLILLLVLVIAYEIF